MLSSIWDAGVASTLEAARTSARPPYPSPEDWRDRLMYFLLVDRFNNPAAPPKVMPFNTPVNAFQGGKYAGVQAAIPYLKGLGIGAVWLSPVLRNCLYSEDSYHGYGIADFLSAEPRFATDPAKADAELRALVDALHDAGMHAIFDIVLNHTGDVFAYAPNPNDPLCTSTSGTQATFSQSPLAVQWRDAHGVPQADWPVIEQIANPPRDALVWPEEIQKNAYLRRQGTIPNWNTTAGDFMALKQILTTDLDLQNALIRIYQHVVAKFDVDGFRIDTLKYLLPSYAQTFCNAIREFCMSIGKKNFFIFGEVYDTSDAKLATFIGRNAMDPDDAMGADACSGLSAGVPLPPAAKGIAPPSHVTAVFIARKQAAAGGAEHPWRREPVFRDVPRQPRSEAPVLLRRSFVARRVRRSGDARPRVPALDPGHSVHLLRDRAGAARPAKSGSGAGVGVGRGDSGGALGQATRRVRHEPSVLHGARGDCRRARLGAGASLRTTVPSAPSPAMGRTSGSRRMHQGSWRSPASSTIASCSSSPTPTPRTATRSRSSWTVR